MELIPTIVTSLAISIVTAWVAVALAFRRYKSEKWWDRKSQCYFETVDALNAIMVVCDAFIDEKIHGLILEESDKIELVERFRRGKAFCFTQINIGQLLMSNEAYSILKGFERELFALEREPHETLWEAIREVTEGYVDALIPAARKDLDPHSYWTNFSVWVKQKMKMDQG